MYTFAYPSILIYILGAQKNPLMETVLLSTQQHMFWMRNKENILREKSLAIIYNGVFHR